MPSTSTYRRIAPHVMWLLVCVIAAAPIWLGPGIIHTRAGGDSPFLLQRTFELAENVRAGIVPARWMPNANFGLGYPFFNFYASLPYYLAAVMHVLGLDLIFSVQFTQALGMLAGGASMWLLARQFLSPHGAALAAIAYTLAPFHLANLYVRGDSLSEFWAFACFPLIVWGVLRGGKRGWWAITLGLAALACTHNVSTLLFAPFFGIISIWKLVKSQESRAKNQEPRTKSQEPRIKTEDTKEKNTDSLPTLNSLLSTSYPLPSTLNSQLPTIHYPLSTIHSLLTAGVAAMMLSAWFWLPALMGTGQVQLDEQTTGYLNYANHFRGANLVQPSLLFDYTVDAKLGVFGMGLAQALLCLIGLALWIRHAQTGRWLIPVLFLLATLLITPLSAPIWQALKPLQLAQFPWRVLSLQSLFAALLIGKIADGSSPSHKDGSVTRLYGLALLLMVTMLARLPNDRLWVNSADVTPERLRLFEWFSGNIGTTIRAEYLPKTALPKPVTGPAMLGQTQAVALTGEMTAATQLSIGPTSQQWQITINSPQAEIVLPLLYWQPWRASTVAQDGSTSAVNLAPNLGSGWVKATLPQGQQQLNLWLGKTPDQRGAEWASLLTALGLAGLGVWQCRQRFDKRRMAMWGLGLIIGIGLMQNVTTLTPQPNAAFGNLQTLDFDGRPYPHRAPLQFWAAAQPDAQPFTLLAAEITPRQVQAGQAFTLSLQWKDNLAPPQVQVIQELPSGVANADLASRIFRYARSVTPANAPSSQHIALPEAPTGPLLLKLAASDASGKPLSATLLTGDKLNEFWLVGLNISATSPTPETKPTLREFANGIRLHELDWQQQDGDHMCIRPVWSSPHPIADALQVSIRIRNAANGEVATVDGQPHLGLSPTWSWQANQFIKDSYCRVPIRNHLQAGDAYQIQMIWYRVSDQAAVGEATLSGTRLPAMNAWHVLGNRE